MFSLIISDDCGACGAIDFVTLAVGDEVLCEGADLDLDAPALDRFRAILPGPSDALTDGSTALSIAIVADSIGSACRGWTSMAGGCSGSGDG